jgi:hypothetical protein
MPRDRSFGAPPPLPPFQSLPGTVRGPSGQPVPAVDWGDGTVKAPLPVQPSLSISPWWLYEYPDAVDFSLTALNFTAAAGATTTVPVGTAAAPQFTFTVPSGYIGVLRQVTMTVQSPVATMNLSLRLLLGNAPIQGWSNRPFPPLALSGMAIGFNGIVIRMPQGSTLTAQFIEASSPASSFTCSLDANGWICPIASIRRLQQGLEY